MFFVKHPSPEKKNKPITDETQAKFNQAVCCSVITHSNPALTFDYLCSQNFNNTYWYRFMKPSMRKEEENEMVISSPVHLSNTRVIKNTKISIPWPVKRAS